MIRRDFLKTAIATTTFLASFGATQTRTRAQSVFTAVDIGLPDGFASAIGADVNDQGEIVLNAHDGERWHAFVLRAGEFLELGDADAETYVNSINNTSVMTGWSRGGELAPVPNLRRAALLGQETTIGLLWTGYESAGWYTDDRAFSVGESIFEDAGAPQAAIWTPETSDPLDGLVPGLPSAAVAINGDGQFGGWAATDEAGATHAVIWTDSVPADLGVLGGRASKLTALTDGGLAVGWSTTADGQENLEADGVAAFIWSESAMSRLPALDNQTWSRANDVNSFGLSVGVARLGAANSDATPVAAGMASPHTVGVAWGVSTAMDINLATAPGSGLNYTEAVAVNSLGQVLCNGYDSEGNSRIALLSTVGT